MLAFSAAVPMGRGARGVFRAPAACGREPLARRGTTVRASLTLPWQDAATIDRGLLTTSFETCTVTSHARVGAHHLRCEVDTSVTCTAGQYARAGQWVWLKPWGDEDGNIAACPLAHVPNGSTAFPLHVRMRSPLGRAVLAGEMLEVSEVMGHGLPPLRGALRDAAEVWAFAAGEAVLSLLPALADLPVGSVVRIFVVAGDLGDDEDEEDDGSFDYEGFEAVEHAPEETIELSEACAELVRDWVDVDGGSRSVTVLRSPLGSILDEIDDLGVKASKGSIAVLACPWRSFASSLEGHPGFGPSSVFVNS